MLYLAMIGIQVLCIVDVIRNGRNQLWIMALVFLPIASTIAYVIVEVLPGLQGNRHVRTAKAKAAQALDPEKEVREARTALDLADTVANRIRLADAYSALRRYADALPLYQQAVKGRLDLRTGEKLARAEFETGDAAGALETLAKVPEPGNLSDQDRIALLRARSLEATNRKDEAAAIYADIVTRLPGEEARCRYAALLLERGERAQARHFLEEVEGRMRHLSRHQRAAEADMYRWATNRLGELRAG